MENNDLQHWGVQGMRWGIRRFQNKDGTLTTAGKKRYAKEEEKLKNREKVIKNKQRVQAKVDKLEAKRKQLDEMDAALKAKKSKKAGGSDADADGSTATKLAGKQPDNTDAQKTPGSQINGKKTNIHKNPHEMSDDELARATKRAENIIKLQKATYKESTGKKLVKSIFSNVIAPVATNYAKDKLSDMLKNTGTEKLASNMKKDMPKFKPDTDSDSDSGSGSAGSAMRSFKIRRKKDTGGTDTPTYSGVVLSKRSNTSDSDDSGSSRSVIYGTAREIKVNDTSPQISSYASTGKSLVSGYLSSPSVAGYLPEPKR